MVSSTALAAIFVLAAAVGIVVKLLPHLIAALQMPNTLLQRKKLKAEVVLLESRIQPATFEDIKRTDAKVRSLLDRIKAFLGLQKGDDEDSPRFSGSARFAGIDPVAIDESMKPGDRDGISNNERMMRWLLVVLTSVLLFGGLYLGIRMLDY